MTSRFLGRVRLRAGCFARAAAGLAAGRTSLGALEARLAGLACWAVTACGPPAAQHGAEPSATPASPSAAPREAAAAATAPGSSASCASLRPAEALAWTADAGATLGAALPLRLGDPKIEHGPQGAALCFDGNDDGLAFEYNPIEGMGRFTIQALFRPDTAGSRGAPSEQRFIHFEEGSVTTPESRRALIETRVVGDEWFLDTYLRAAGEDRTLVDPQKKHAVGHWYWVALTYADGTMRHYVDGQPELEGAVAFEPLCPGRASLGVRLNRVSWFKGCLRELRVTPAVLAASDLEKMR